MKHRFLFVFALIYAFSSLTFGQEKKEFKIPYEQYKLANGLDVILHLDKSDPIATVYVCYHVGSNREKKGRTGFAHLFEHIMFQESQHIPQDQFFKKIQGAGGTLNGSTSNDRTNYFETVPKNALEMALWMEADRMGFLLSTLSQESFENQQNVVQNEKRQGDNEPYSQTEYVLGKLLYPDTHPYNWDVIGEMEDLANASLQDVIDFHRAFYGPSNATLVVSGDLDIPQTKQWIEKYYGEIQATNQAQPLPKMRVTLTESKRAYIEDKLANAPDLNMVFPTVEQYSADAYPLRYLGQLLAGSKKTPFYKVIVEEKRLAPEVSVYNYSQELTGALTINVQTFPGKNLGEVEAAIAQALTRFEKEGFSDADLARLKTSVEVGFYNSIASTMGKAMRLGEYNEYAGQTDFINTDLNNLLKVQKEDIWRVYNQYVKGKPSVLLCTVPKGKAELAAANCTLFPLKEEALDKQGVKKTRAVLAKMAAIPTSFDRTKEPIKGPDPVITLPQIWTSKTDNGIPIFGVVHSELPLVQFMIVLKGGQSLDPIDKLGIANLTARMLSEGTKTKTPVELREAMQDLGATLTVYAGPETIVLNGRCLSGKLTETIALAKEMLLEPRWDEKEFPLVKSQVIDNLKQMEASPSDLAGIVFGKLVYGADCPAAYPVLGTTKTVQAITLDDLKAHYARSFSPNVARIVVAGDVSTEKASQAFATLNNWAAKPLETSQIKITTPAKPGLYFIDIPGAKQSQFRVGHLGPVYTDSDHYRAVVMNHRLGGDFNGLLNMILREEKGFTYGARSAFSAAGYPGTFIASTSVQTNATQETAQIIRDQIAKYREGISADDLAMVKSTLLKGNALKFETINALCTMLLPVANYGLPQDYIMQNQSKLQQLSGDEQKALAQKYLQPEKMIYLIVGDKASQFAKLKELNLGAPVLLDKEGQPVKQ